MIRQPATREEILHALSPRRKSSPPSRQNLGGWEPKTCCVCGERVIAKNGIFTRGLGGQPTSRHHTCQES